MKQSDLNPQPYSKIREDIRKDANNMKLTEHNLEENCPIPKRRISFSGQDALSLLEWRLALLQYHHDEVNCGTCEHLQEILEKFLGEKEVKKLYKLMKKYPYAKLPRRTNAGTSLHHTLSSKDESGQ